MILLLAGTTEARNLAGYLAAHDVACVASLAGVTRDPVAYPVETRVGRIWRRGRGFAPISTLRGITAVIDATHPFATPHHRTHRADMCGARRAVSAL